MYHLKTSVMKIPLLKPAFTAVPGGLLTAPATGFIILSLWKYVFGHPAPFDAVIPALEKWGIGESIGWNINLLILLGPVAGILLNLPSVLKVDWQDHEVIHIQVRWAWALKNWIVMAVCGGCLMTLLIYLLGENCQGR